MASTAHEFAIVCLRRDPSDYTLSPFRTCLAQYHEWSSKLAITATRIRLDDVLFTLLRQVCELIIPKGSGNSSRGREHTTAIGEAYGAG